MNTGVKAKYQFSTDELKEIRELLFLAKNNQKHPAPATNHACDKHIQTINQILSDRSK